jgi:hypothetical protein
MFTVRKQLRGFVWLALTAIVGLSLLPTLAHALNFAQGGNSSLAEICTPQGMQWVQFDGAPSDGDRPLAAVDHMEDCPYCARAMSMAGLPPPALQLQLQPPAGGAKPPLFLHAPRTPVRVDIRATARPSPSLLNTR